MAQPLRAREKQQMNDPDELQTKEESQQENSATVVQERGQRRSRNRPLREISVNMDELRELIALVRENGFGEFEYERHGFRVRFRKESEITVSAALGRDFASEEFSGGSQSPYIERVAAEARTSSTSVPAHPGARAVTAASEDQDLHIIPSPIVGTFYRAPSPNADAFVKIGSRVEPDTVVCIIEAMKLMNEIQAEASGEVAKIYVENGQPVEYGQPLFGIKK